MGKDEAELMNSERLNSNLFLVAAAEIKGLVVFRNNCGVLPDGRGAMIRFGVGNECGGSDFIGWYNGRFCAFEIKADKDNTSPERLKKQENFIQRINDIGGCAGFVRRGEDVARILTGRLPNCVGSKSQAH